jgi:hypothetical protein
LDDGVGEKWEVGILLGVQAVGDWTDPLDEYTLRASEDVQSWSFTHTSAYIDISRLSTTDVWVDGDGGNVRLPFIKGSDLTDPAYRLFATRSQIYCNSDSDVYVRLAAVFKYSFCGGDNCVWGSDVLLLWAMEWEKERILLGAQAVGDWTNSLNEYTLQANTDIPLCTGTSTLNHRWKSTTGTSDVRRAIRGMYAGFEEQ